MVFVIAHEIISETQREKTDTILTMMLMIELIVMLLLDISLGSNYTKHNLQKILRLQILKIENNLKHDLFMPHPRTDVFNCNFCLILDYPIPADCVDADVPDVFSKYFLVSSIIF